MRNLFTEPIDANLYHNGEGFTDYYPWSSYCLRSEDRQSAVELCDMARPWDDAVFAEHPTRAHALHGPVQRARARILWRSGDVRASERARMDLREGKAPGWRSCSFVEPRSLWVLPLARMRILPALVVLGSAHVFTDYAEIEEDVVRGHAKKWQFASQNPSLKGWASKYVRSVRLFGTSR